MKRNKVSSLPSTKNISTFMYEIKIKKINLKPDYQREIVWKNKNDKDELLRSVFLGYPIGVITMREFDGVYEIVDGLQRSKILLDFFSGNKSYSKISALISKEIINNYLEEIMNDKNFGDKNASTIIRNLKRGVMTLLSYEKLPISLKNQFDSYPLNINNILRASDNDIRSFFRVLQNQEKLKAGEVINSLIDNPILEIVSKYPKIKDTFSKILFDNNRQEFQKYLVLFHGIFSDKIKIGVMDRRIIDYAVEMKENKVFNKRIENLLVQLNSPEIFSNILTDRSFNKFSMKLLIGLYVFNVDFINEKSIREIVQILYKISELISMNNSIKNNNVPEKFKSSIKKIAIIAKTTHKKEVLMDALDELEKMIRSIDVNKLMSSYELKFRYKPSLKK